MPVQTFHLTIDSLAYGPAGVGRADGKVIFVPGTVPGDEVEVVLDQEKKTYATGHVVALSHPSPWRRHPPCPYVARCGGCPWQQVSYTEQLRAKEMLVREHMRRIGGMADPSVLPIIASPQEWHYRHRIRVHVTDNSRLGFSPPRSHELVEIESCLIATAGTPENLRLARAWLTVLSTAVRDIELLTSESDGKLVMVGVAADAFQASDDVACQRFLQTHSQIAGLLLSGRNWQRRWGEPRLVVDLGLAGLTIEVSHGTFTQISCAGNRALIAAVLRLSDIQKEQRVIELYCGAGNLSLPLASRARELIGIEQNRLAVADARANAVRSSLMNTRFMYASVRDGVRRLRQAGERADVVVLDPPRTGAAEIIAAIPRLGARKVVYVSCDPASLARDLRQLHLYGYRTDVIQPIDLFPQTYHVETIAVSLLTC
jgi:23S rRNA (uracil1939-C5)-methyltransferase